jgi:ABC-type glycerol-3-phosphate transport system permease component
MPVILKTERRSTSARLIYLGMYIILGLGAITMVYPFMLMLSGSFKSRVDASDFDIIPSFLTDDDQLYRKQQEAKYNENMQLYTATTGASERNFKAITAPPSHAPTLLTDYQDFLSANELPSSWFVVGYGPTLEGRILQENERAFRDFIKARCNADLAQFQRDFAEPIADWFYLRFQLERLTDRKYQIADTPLMTAFYEFKATLPESDRIYVSCDGEYAKFAALREAEASILAADARDPLWESYVREALHPQFIQVADSAKPDWQAFLLANYADIAQLNKLYRGESFADFASVPFPENRMHASAALTDYLRFVSGPAPLAALSVDTPETRWRAFLRDRYPDAQSAATAHGRSSAGFAEIAIPRREVDFAQIQADRGTFTKRFLTRNYSMVFDYIVVYGRGVWNTIVYCFWAVVLALLVNPLAAYALSRYKLPSQYKILLLLISTMAFPAVVTMIPNFLLLRDLGMLNTFAALLLPGMANGYAIFLLKGFFDSLPRELYEAADIDGAGEWQKFWLITMNLSKPILAVIALGAFTGAYANFMFAFILCQDSEMWTLMVWLYQLQQFSSQGVAFAALIIAGLPTLLVFILCQNVIIKGIVVPTEK